MTAYSQFTVLPLNSWPTPTPLPDELPSVAPFDYSLLPPLLHRRVADVAERMQCPPDLVAIPLIIALSSVIGRRCGIAPQRHGDWYCVPNLWGYTTAPPGFHKTPAAREAIIPLENMQVHAVAEFESAQSSYEAQTVLAEQAKKVAADAIRKALRAGKKTEASEEAERVVQIEHEKPTCRRFIVNDCTMEKCGELLRENPQGLLLMRDELAGLFASLERQGHESDRAFLLEAWNGTGFFSYDRIGRGSIHIPALCLSIFGTIQPGPLSMLVRRCTGLGNDGLLQRFQLAVWPDVFKKFKLVNRPSDGTAKDAVANLFERLDRLTAEGLGADAGPVPLLRFSEEAQQAFDVWHTELEHRLRADAEPAILIAHFAKYRSLVPSLALILHLVEADEGPVSLAALKGAIAWAVYLETHAANLCACALP